MLHARGSPASQIMEVLRRLPDFRRGCWTLGLYSSWTAHQLSHTGLYSNYRTSASECKLCDKHIAGLQETARTGPEILTAHWCSPQQQQQQQQQGRAPISCHQQHCLHYQRQEFWHHQHHHSVNTAPCTGQGLLHRWHPTYWHGLPLSPAMQQVARYRTQQTQHRHQQQQQQQQPQDSSHVANTATDSSNASCLQQSSQLLQQLQPFSVEQHDIRCMGSEVLQTVALKKYHIPQHSTHSSHTNDGYLQWAIKMFQAWEVMHPLPMQYPCNRLNEAGHIAHFAGGWVRDALLGRPSADIDITTSANVLQQLPQLFPQYRIRQLPRSTARMEWGPLSLEITQLKGPRKLADLDSLYFDACMRDFTINSLYYDPVHDEVLDFLGGVEHLQNKVLDLPPYLMSGLDMPSQVIAADPLRVLRAARFAASLDLQLTEALRKQLLAHADKCRFENHAGSGGVGNRRLFKELKRVCGLASSQAGPTAVCKAFELMAELQLLHALFPEISAPDPSTCGALQALLDATASNTPVSNANHFSLVSKGSKHMEVPMAMRIMVLVDPCQDTSHSTLQAINQRMLKALGDVWSSDVFNAGQQTILLYQHLRRLDKGSEFPSMDMHAFGWPQLMQSQVWPLLDSWMQAWMDPSLQQQWQRACHAVQSGPQK